MDVAIPTKTRSVYQRKGEGFFHVPFPASLINVEFIMGQIPLSRGYSTIVDDEDEMWLDWKKWFAIEEPTYKKVYVVRYKQKNKIRQMISMPHKILKRYGYKIPIRYTVDHKNSDSLDNRKSNLRICTMAQNNLNKSKRIIRTSKYKGLCHNKRHNRWIAYITLNRKTYHLGYFDDEIEAAKAYNEKAKELHGEFARLNKI